MPIEYMCERGNTWLVSEEGNHLAYFNLPNGGVMEVSIVPENYPGFEVSTLNKKAIKGLSKHLKDLVATGNWIVRKAHHIKG